ncbi:hypothetical protein [Mycobacteroides abscessus]|uniref:hypothetical protein n=1 Tax=Mycobacteroides abscessus TaxID=36809 RepID=UPI000C2692D4|nr:hypothetical protein [Mycobacteroides abscessus]
MNDDTKTETAPARHTKRRRAVIAAGATLALLGVTAGGYALHQSGVKQGREQVPAAAPATDPKPPTLRSNDGTCGSRLELHSGDKVFALMLDGPNDFRVLDVTVAAKVPSGGCSLGRDIPGGPKTEDSTGASSAQIRSGWDTQLNRCSRYVTIDGRRWVLDDPQFTELGYLAHGGYGRILAGDARCGGELPMQPYGGAQCPDHGNGWRYAWDAVRGECVRDSPAENRGEPQGATTK